MQTLMPMDDELPPAAAYSDEHILAGMSGGRAQRRLNGSHGLNTAPTTGDQGGAHTQVPPLDWPALDGKTPPDREWAIKHWLGMGHVTLLAGPGAIGKTLLAQTIASHLAWGQSIIDEIERPRKVLMWACEDDHDELWRRQIAIAAHMDVSLSAFEENLVIVPRAGNENTLLTNTYGSPGWTPLIEELREQVNDLKIDVLILDNVRQLCANEIDGHFVTRFVNTFAAMRPGLATVLLAHPSRAQGSEFSGNGAWENACRMRWYLGNKLPGEKHDDPDDEGETDTRYLYKRKANYSAKDVIKLDYRDGLLLPNEASQGAPVGDIFRAGLAENIVLKSIPRLIAMGKCPTDGATSPEYLPRLMIEFKLQENMTKRDLTSAMRGLMLSGRIRKQIAGQYANRSPKMGLVLV